LAQLSGQATKGQRLQSTNGQRAQRRGDGQLSHPFVRPSARPLLLPQLLECGSRRNVQLDGQADALVVGHEPKQ
jgi:hypothetical protein